MSEDTGIVNISYVCEACGQAIKLKIDKSVHQNRRELMINGLATYIDVHADKNNHRHGVKLSIDKDFNVRTNTTIEVKQKKVDDIGIPLPSMKINKLTTKFNWESWKYLELDIKSEGLKFLLEKNEHTPSAEKTIESRIETISELHNVECKLDAVVPENSVESLGYISRWMESFCNALELSSSIHVDLIPEILRYIDSHAHRDPYYSDRVVLAILIDKASILIPNKNIMKYLKRYGPGLPLIGLDPVRFSSIIEKISEYDDFVMADIQTILEQNLEKDTELAEEYIIISIAYMLTMDALDYKLSYLSLDPNDL